MFWRKHYGLVEITCTEQEEESDFQRCISGPHSILQFLVEYLKGIPALKKTKVPRDESIYVYIIQVLTVPIESLTNRLFF